MKPSDRQPRTPSQLSETVAKIMHAAATMAYPQQTIEAILREAMPSETASPVAWFRIENGMRVYYETPAWPSMTPLYATPSAIAEHRWFRVGTKVPTAGAFILVHGTDGEYETIRDFDPSLPILEDCTHWTYLHEAPK